MNYFGARYYNPVIGYWISLDKAEQFWSGYSYTANGFNPVNAVDPDGNTVGSYLVSKTIVSYYRTNQVYKDVKMMKDPYPVGGKDNENDAFKHVYASAEITRRVGRLDALVWGTARELYGAVKTKLFPNDSPTPGSGKMDLTNNSLGREIGSNSKSSHESLKLSKETVDGGKANVMNPTNKKD